MLYQFPVASISNDDKHSGLEQYRGILTILELKPEMSPSWPQGYNEGVGRADFLLKVLRVNPFPCLFQLLEATHIPWLVVLPPSSNPAALKSASSDLSL